MPKTKISEFSATPANNTDIDSINISEGCAPSGINDAIRELMAQLKDFQTGAVGDSFNGPVGTTTAAAGAFTTLSASSTVSGTGFSTYLASPPAIGGTAAAAGSFTTLSASGAVTLSGGTANGVAYLNGSKVVTSGSALVFDGTNLGLGVTPSAWGSTKAFDIGTYGALAQLSTVLNLSYNSYFNGTNTIYKNTGVASVYQQSSGGHIWYTAPSGTAGNAITFTQAMTLTADSNLLIGTTTTDARVSIALPSVGAYNSQTSGWNVSNGTGAMRLWIANLTYAGVGANEPWLHSYQNINIGSDANIAIKFISGGEKARIDSSGNLLVGATSTVASAAFLVSKSVNDYLARFINSNATAYGVVVNYSGATPNSTGQEFFRCVDSTADRMLVRSNGGIANYSGNNVNLSDRREKTNFSPASSYLDKICAIPVQTFNYVDQNMEEDGGLTLGVVAQDVQAVAPELVMESNWGTKDQPKMRLSIYQTDLQYALMKCIQEQQAIIESLKARLDAANL